jgi:hypothetical protein
MLDIGKAQGLRDLAYRQIRFHQQAHDLVRSQALDIVMHGRLHLPLKFYFQGAAR